MSCRIVALRGLKEIQIGDQLGTTAARGGHLFAQLRTLPEVRRHRRARTERGERGGERAEAAAQCPALFRVTFSASCGRPVSR